MIYDFSHISFVYCGSITDCQRGMIVRTYAEHVKNICHIELANPLTKHTLLVIG